MERGDMQVEVLAKKFTVEEYYRMAEVGIIGPEDRTELIDGQIIQMSPPGTAPPAVNEGDLTNLLRKSTSRSANALRWINEHTFSAYNDFPRKLNAPPCLKNR
jgi:Uma2 family endonuclease